VPGDLFLISMSCAKDRGASDERLFLSAELEALERLLGRGKVRKLFKGEGKSTDEHLVAVQ
jgi:hypothetical protein